MSEFMLLLLNMIIGPFLAFARFLVCPPHVIVVILQCLCL